MFVLTLFVVAVVVVQPSSQCGGGGGGDNGAAVEAQRESRAQELKLWCYDNCASEWGFWTQCTKPCAGGTQMRTRALTNHEWCTSISGFACLHALEQSRSCNEGCSYGGTPQSGNCVCPDTRKGTCCEQERTCDYPGRPAYGSVTGSWPATVGAVAQFSCEQGFELVGDSFRRCKKEGWDNQQPTCERIMCTAPQILTDNVRLLNERDGYVFGDIVMYGCTDGHELEGPRLRECVAAPGGGGRWDGFDPVCTAVKCPDPGLPLHGSREGHDLTYMSVMTFECDPGYKLVGTPTLTCLASGTWLGHFPACEEIQCDAPAVPEHSRLRMHRVNDLPTASFTCDDGYQRQGAESITCGDFGEWDEQPPICRAVDCGSPGVPENGYMQGSATTFPNNVTYACHLGYKLIGATESQCLDTATWSNSPPTCQVCPLNTFYRDGDCSDCPANSHTATEGSTAITQCVCNFGFNGEPGTECVQTQCMELDPPTFGTQVSCERTVGGQCSFTCDDGYVMERGTNIRTCQVTGEWDGEQPFCGPCKVDTYKVSERSCAPCPQHSHTEAAAQMLEGCVCDDGFRSLAGGPCSDVDECLEDQPCEDQCENTEGSFSCRCTIPGYKNDPADMTQCIAERECRNLTMTDAPQNGGLVCKWFTQENSQFCGVRCNPNYEHPVRANEYETCGPVTNYTWSFQVLTPTAVIPPCIKAFFPGIRLQADIFYFTSKCNDLTPEEQDAVKAEFAQVLTNNGVCIKAGNQLCDIRDMGIICGEEVRRKRRDAEDEVVQSVEVAFNVTGLKMIQSPDDCGPEVCAQLNIPENYCEQLCVRSYNRYIRASVMYAEQQLKDMYRNPNTLQQVVLQAANRIFAPQLNGVSTSGVLAECDSGMEWNAEVETCVPCPVGSYLSHHNNTCVACPVMSYQNREQQEECIPCPVGTHNNQSGLAYCLACEQGRYGAQCAFTCECVNGGCDPILGKCICFAGYEGESCEIDIPGCRDQTCAPEVTCHDVPAPNTGITCGPCPAGSHGDGFTCTPNGPGAVVVKRAVGGVFHAPS